MSYEQFYQLREQPFSNTPDARFFFEVDQHADVLARLMYAVDTMKGLAVVVGDVGTGKTTLARRMLDQLDDEQYESALLVIIHSAISAEWLLRRIASQIGIAQAAEEKVAILTQIYQRLMELHEAGRKAVVLIDEANMLQQRELMEELRGFLNLEVPGSKLITFILFGLAQPGCDPGAGYSADAAGGGQVPTQLAESGDEQGLHPAPAQGGGRDAGDLCGGRARPDRAWIRGGFPA